MIQATGSPPRIALIGVSGYARVYAEWLLGAHERGEVILTAVTILPSERRLPIALGLQSVLAEIYVSYEQMFEAEAGKIDLCFIPTGIHWHSPMAIAALKAGANVLVEKPLAGSMADAERVQAAEKRYGKWVAVGFQDMYASEIFELKQSLLDGMIGKLKTVSMIGVWPRVSAYYTRNTWAGKLSVNGKAVNDSPLNNAFSHFVNLSLFLAGDTVETSTTASVLKAELYRAHHIQSFDTAVVQATADNGISLWFGVTHASESSIEPRIRIEGERGSIVWEYDNDCTISPSGQEPVRMQLPKYNENRQRMFESVFRRQHSPGVWICDTTIAKSHTQLIENIHQNATIEPVRQDLIQIVNHSSENQTMPAIKGIANRLEAAFATASELGDLSKLRVEA